MTEWVVRDSPDSGWVTREEPGAVQDPDLAGHAGQEPDSGTEGDTQDVQPVQQAVAGAD
jgi:hypothetical protein